MSEASTPARLAGAFAELLEPLAEAARLEPRPYGLLLWLEDHAIDLERHDVDPDGLVPIVTDFVASADLVDALLGGGELPAPGDVPALIDAIAGFVLSLEALAGVELGDEADFDPAALARLTLDALVTDYLEVHHADLFHLLRLLDVARAAEPHFGIHARLRPERVRDWIERPAPTARGVYGWGGERFGSDDLLERLTPVLRSMGLPATLEESPLDLRRALTGEGDGAPLPPAAWQLQVPLMNLGDETGDGDARAELGLRLVPLTATAPDANDAGLALVPYGHGDGTRLAHARRRHRRALREPRRRDRAVRPAHASRSRLASRARRRRHAGGARSSLRHHPRDARADVRRRCSPPPMSRRSRSIRSGSRSL